MIICLMHREFDKMFSISVTTEYNNLLHKSQYSAMQKDGEASRLFSETSPLSVFRVLSWSIFHLL